MVLRRHFAVVACAILAASCGDNRGFCPGLCPGNEAFPTMIIEVDRGAASIATAKIISGPCSHLLTRSAGEAGAPTGYAAAQITYNGPSDVVPSCLVQLTSLAGAVVVVTASATATTVEQPCCPFASCCAEANANAAQHRVVFDQPLLTVVFPEAPRQVLDGGVPDFGLDAEGAGGDASGSEVTRDIPQTAAQDAAMDEAKGSVVDAEPILGLLLTSLD